jgi:raffinose/stachyose/melibiose transport system permease protein
VPCIITTVAVSQLFRSMYAVEPQGLVNQALTALGLGNLARSWLTDVNTALAFVSIPEGWRLPAFTW